MHKEESKIYPVSIEKKLDFLFQNLQIMKLNFQNFKFSHLSLILLEIFRST